MAVDHVSWARFNRDPGDAYIPALENELMRKKVKRGRDAATVGRQRKRGEPAWRYLEGGVPVVVCERRQAKRQLANDLRPHVECGVGVAPLLERQGRPELAYRDIGRHGHTSLSESPDQIS